MLLLYLVDWFFVCLFVLFCFFPFCDSFYAIFAVCFCRFPECINVASMSVNDDDITAAVLVCERERERERAFR